MILKCLAAFVPLINHPYHPSKKIVNGYGHRDRDRDVGIRNMRTKAGPKKWRETEKNGRQTKTQYKPKKQKTKAKYKRCYRTQRTGCACNRRTS
jgi:hypothetical protein